MAKWYDDTMETITVPRATPTSIPGTGLQVTYRPDGPSLVERITDTGALLQSFHVPPGQPLFMALPLGWDVYNGERLVEWLVHVEPDQDHRTAVVTVTHPDSLRPPRAP
jgi:hypothetical protein